jgi:hypothetical protein
MKTERNISKLSRFSFLKGIKQVLRNFKLLFTGELLSGRNGWIEERSEDSVVDDVSLIMENGEPKFVKTPKEARSALMVLTKTIEN